MEEKNLQLERTVFFCDAVVAIAITLLALDIKIERIPGGHITFADIFKERNAFFAFFLSFINIANFWKNHHMFFSHIKKMDERLLWFNIMWLFFIVLLPFSTSLVGSYFGDVPAMFMYSFNTFLITIFQNMIWDYPALKKDFLKEGSIDELTAKQVRLYCNLDMVNALVAVGLSFFYPKLAFIFLFTKLPMMIGARFVFRDAFPVPRKPGDRKR